MIRRKISSGMFIKLGFLAFLGLLWPFLRRPRLAAAIISLILQFSLFFSIFGDENLQWAVLFFGNFLRPHAPSKNSSQVWTLSQFFLFPFGKKSLFYLEGKSMTPHWGNTIFFRSSQQLPRLCLGPLKGILS